MRLKAAILATAAIIVSALPAAAQQKKVIAEYPFGDTLDRVRNKLRDSNEADETHWENILNL